jgi:hypothetical protein
MQVNMVEPAFVRKRDVLQNEIARQLKIKYQNFFCLTIMSRNLSKTYYFSDMSEYMCISFNLFYGIYKMCYNVSVLPQQPLSDYIEIFGLVSHGPGRMLFNKSGF